LAATAISNLQAARWAGRASRAHRRCADDERRRVVRDLHDGAQQRVVDAVITGTRRQQRRRPRTRRASRPRFGSTRTRRARRSDQLDR